MSILICLLFSALFFFGAVKYLKKGLATRSWSKATGSIMSSEVSERTVTHAGGRQHKEYRLKLSYEYVVDGETYTSERIDHRGTNNGYGTLSNATKLSHLYPVDAVVRVFYNPSDPKDVVLVTGVGWVPIIMLSFFGLLSLAVAVLLVIFPGGAS